MKKLSQNFISLSREEMRKIQGGGGSCLGLNALCHKNASYPHTQCCEGLECDLNWGGQWGTCKSGGGPVQE